MRYMGSKTRIAKQILPIILKDRKEDQLYVEPFVGGGNLIDKVTGLRLGADGFFHAINALKAIRDHINSLPKSEKEFTENDYKKLKFLNEYTPIQSFAGFTYSFGGKWLGGWSRDADNTDYVCRAYKSATKQTQRLQGVRLEHSEYKSLIIPNNSIVYCDPPYSGTTSYQHKFNSEEFFDWCRQLSEYCKVFISESNAPKDFNCVWEGTVSSGIRRKNKKPLVERLYTRP